MLDLIAVIEHLGRVGDGVELLAVMADGEGEHRTRLFSRQLGDAGVEHLLAAVELDAVDIGVMVIEHVGGPAIGRQLHSARAEGIGHLAGLVQTVGLQVEHVQVVRVIGGDHVFVAGDQCLALFGKGRQRAGAEDGNGGEAASSSVQHAGFPLVRLCAHLSSGNTVPRLRQLSLEAWASLFQSG
ncbi:hypothetical protein D3C85_1374360 [compost metagenome]